MNGFSPAFSRLILVSATALLLSACGQDPTNSDLKQRLEQAESELSRLKQPLPVSNPIQGVIREEFSDGQGQHVVLIQTSGSSVRIVTQEGTVHPYATNDTEDEVEEDARELPERRYFREPPRTAPCPSKNKAASARSKKPTSSAVTQSAPADDLSSPPPATVIRVTTLPEFEQQVIHSGIPVAFIFEAQWCGYCRAFSKVSSAAALQSAGRYKIVTVDVDASPAINSKYKLKSAVPEIQAYSHGSRLKAPFEVGALTAPAFDAFLARFALPPSEPPVMADSNPILTPKF